MLRLWWCFPVLFLTSFVHGQESTSAASGEQPRVNNNIPASVLHVNGAKGMSSVPTTAIILPVRCKSSGEVYFRTYEPRETHQGVIGISADGSKVVHYDVPDTPEYKGATIYDFFLNQEGKVVIPLQVEDKAYLLEFDDRGQVHAAMPIEDTVWIAHVAAFDKGYLITGLKHGDSDAPSDSDTSADGRPKLTNYAAVFSDSGKLVKTLDALDGASVANGEENAKESTGTAESGDQSAILNDYPLTGPDGNVYMLHGGDNPSVSEMKSNGEIAHRFTVAEPEPGFKASQLLLAPGKVAVIFLKTSAGQNDSAMISVLNADGQATQRYALAPDVIGIPACFDGQQFTFLGNEDGHAVLRTALAR